jgi:hypothetical protein
VFLRQEEAAGEHEDLIKGIEYEWMCWKKFIIKADLVDQFFASLD